jgi:hypothetical protein
MVKLNPYYNLNLITTKKNLIKKWPIEVDPISLYSLIS